MEGAKCVGGQKPKINENDRFLQFFPLSVLTGGASGSEPPTGKMRHAPARPLVPQLSLDKNAIKKLDICYKQAS